MQEAIALCSGKSSAQVWGSHFVQVIPGVRFSPFYHPYTPWLSVITVVVGNGLLVLEDFLFFYLSEVLEELAMWFLYLGIRGGTSSERKMHTCLCNLKMEAKWVFQNGVHIGRIAFHLHCELWLRKSSFVTYLCLELFFSGHSTVGQESKLACFHKIKSFMKNTKNFVIHII